MRTPKKEENKENEDTQKKENEDTQKGGKKEMKEMDIHFF